jgi:hypothetical protein
MGGLFDINHNLHGPTAMIGIVSLRLAAVILIMAMARRDGIVAPPLWSAHLALISSAPMPDAFVFFFSSLKVAGVDMSGHTEQLRELPAGVSGYMVVALPCRTWPIAHPFMLGKTMHHQTPGSNT